VSNRTGSRRFLELVLLFFLIFSALTTYLQLPQIRRRYHPPPPFILPRLQMRDGGISPSRRVLFFVDKGTYACRGSGTLAYLHVCSTRRADYFAYLSTSLACRRMFAPCEESDSRMVFISKARGVERAVAAVHSSPGMSVQPDIPIVVSTPLPT